MPEFESWKSYGEFACFVRRTARHLMDAKNQRFLDAVIQTSASRKGVIEKDAVLWRAQLGNDWRPERMCGDNGQEILLDAAHPFSPERMMPRPDRANEGRVNPKGIPCLYLSTDRD